MNLMMKKIRFLIRLVTILSLCIGFANATGTGMYKESLVSENDTGSGEILTFWSCSPIRLLQ